MKPTIIVQAVEKVSLALLASADRMADRAEKLLRTNIEQLESDLNQANWTYPDFVERLSLCDGHCGLE